ncbi:NADH:ubiquinone reductase (Na(+)-transporting) subunit C [Fulvivirgaceae bacterium BMA10]|uniref:Na(+)-translocating NADH-quinone reductase subunit C n=1 Tax=Splendidivirga corallicola TaxID=3051826 RepID=A0ABT8KQJ5_9BACT|nr:NADH:ubiquinone reductase (Na(+)-transporting) subunit C [Fulvivirgaceae bacterium BMA10]
MQQSNGYIIIFTVITTIIIGGALSFTSQVLGPAQKRSIELDTKSQILKAVMEIKEGDDVLGIYDQRIKSLVVDYNGNEITTNAKGAPIVAEEVNILKNYKKSAEDREYPVFMFMSESNPDEVESYILPIYGAGLWDKIWGFVALDKSLQSIQGVVFDHKGETPGLGARISDKEVQDRFKNKKIYDQGGSLVSVSMLKGEKGEPLGDHHVDGLSGATLTAKGVNDMLLRYLGSYQAYFKKINPDLVK